MTALPIAGTFLAIATSVLVSSLIEDDERHRSNASTRAIMRVVIAPAADPIFQSVSVRQTLSGEVEEAPATAEAWALLEMRAATLAEGANLLLAPEGSRARHRLTLDRGRWNRYAIGLRDAAGWALDAARRRSAPRLLSAGGDISLACERCHLAFVAPGGRRYLPAEEFD